jgi:N-methylhydantoinase A
METGDAALGVLQIANANMLRILRLVSVNRGHDPRDFTLVAYGGAGPIHATMLGEMLSITRVIVPGLPGLFSALGLLSADVTADFVETGMLALHSANIHRINAAFDRLRAKASDWFERMEVNKADRSLSISADLRYTRQNYELRLPWPDSSVSQADIDRLKTQFHRAHASEYGHSAEGEGVQVIHFRLRATKVLKKPDFTRKPGKDGRFEDAVPKKNRYVRFPEGKMRCQVLQREDLQPGNTFSGPAVIQEKNATTLVQQDWSAQVDIYGNLLIERK